MSSQHVTENAHSPVSLPSSPLPFLGLTFTPPQSFRTTPCVSPSPQVITPIQTATAAPAISVTDELGYPAHFPIIPPPHAFAHEFSDSAVSGGQYLQQMTYSQPNLQQRMSLDEGDSQQHSDEDKESGSGMDAGSPSSAYSQLYRWKDGNKGRPPPPVAAYGP